MLRFNREGLRTQLRNSRWGYLEAFVNEVADAEVRQPPSASSRQPLASLPPIASIRVHGASALRRRAPLARSRTPL